MCTHLLPDDVVVMASQAAENMGRTDQILKQLRESETAKLLGKASQTWLVHSRVPRGRPVWGEFTIHSSPKLEAREFLAMMELADLVQEFPPSPPAESQ